MMMEFILGLLLGTLLTLPLFPDPYGKDKEHISFWLWLYRELAELLHEEKDLKA